MSKPEIGMSMLHCLGKPFPNVIENISTAKTRHFELVDDGFHTLTKSRVATLKNIGTAHGLRFSVHAPFSDINIASPSKPILKTVLKQLEKSISYASDLDAYLWVFHPGLKTGISMFYPQQDWLQNLNSIRLLLKIAEDYRVKIAIENVPEPFPFLMKNVEQFTQFYREINENIGFVLDIGHANVNQQTEQFITTFADKIVHIHAHDNRGKEDQHLGVGYGTVNWKKTATLLKEASYNNTIVIESVEHVQESIDKLKQLFQ